MNVGIVMVKKYLTNEKLRGIFKNNFELANAAIAYARSHILENQDKNLDELIDEITKYVRDEKSSHEG